MLELLGRQFLDGEGGEDHVLDPEPGVDRVELAGQQFRQMHGVAARPRGADADVLDPAVDAVKTEIEPAHAHAFARQPGHEIERQPLGGAGEVGGVGNRLGRLRRTRRLGASPSGESGSGSSPSAWSSRRATVSPKRRVSASRGIASDLADPPQPDPVQALDDGWVEPQRGDRQRRQRGGAPARRDDDRCFCR